MIKEIGSVNKEQMKLGTKYNLEIIIKQEEKIAAAN